MRSDKDDKTGDLANHLAQIATLRDDLAQNGDSVEKLLRLSELSRRYSRLLRDYDLWQKAIDPDLSAGPIQA
ncbi:MAG: hypothetical protein MI920_14790 [Kiloniellales bacterium]|nr:hypothetical protein [Kiloniellales bacterium]